MNEFVTSVISSSRGLQGLKKMRNRTGKEPTYKCSNCKCIRYSSCNCSLPKGKERKEEVTE